MLKPLTLKTSHTSELIDITKAVSELVITSGIKEGICTIFTPHTTASVLLFENLDPKLRRDLLGELKKCAPSSENYLHDGNNADAHLKSAIIGSTITVPLSNAQLLLGQWQGIFFAEFDGPREARTLYVKIIAG